MSVDDFANPTSAWENDLNEDMVTKRPPAKPSVDPIVLEMCDMVGNIMEFWGFRKVLGRIWTLLYLSPAPLSAADMKELLGMSVGSVSMAVQELERWGVVKKTYGPVARRDYYEAETHLWKMVSRVFRERERITIENALEQMKKLRLELEHRMRFDAKSNAELSTFQRDRIAQLINAAQIALKLLDALIATARIDASPLRNLQLVKELTFGVRKTPTPKK